MRWFLLFVFLGVHTAYSQTPTAGYDHRWNMVDSLMYKKGLTESALEEVNKIYILARKEKNEAQMIKALVYRIRLGQERSEEGLPAAIRELQRETDSSSQPARSILQNMLASLYQQYLQENIWRIRGRMETMIKNDSDITTWPAADLERAIKKLYLHSLDAERLLAHIDLSRFEPIIHEGQDRGLRPTLFDLLARRALEFFKSGELYVVKPVHPFRLSDPMAFGDDATFSQHRFSTEDSLAGHYLAIRLFQRLTLLHLADARPDALITVDIERLDFVHSNSTAADREPAFMQELGRLTKKYPDLPAAAQAWYLQANQFYMQGIGRQQPEDSLGSIKARKICEQVILEPDSSEGKANCSRLLQLIVQKQLTLKTEKVNIPYRPFRTLVVWQNFDRLYLRLIRIKDLASDETAFNGPRRSIYDSAYVKELLAAPVYRSFAQDLPETPDLREHKTEIAIGSLAPGGFALLASSDSTWSGKHGVMGLEYFSVSSIAYISRDNDYFILNRETGKPIAGAVVRLLDQTFIRPPHGVRERDTSVYTSDADGHFSPTMGKNGGHSIQLLDISIPGDRLRPMEGNYYPLVTEDMTTFTDKRVYEEKHAHCFLFTDRSIYRPGQTLYFKGIVVTTDFDTHRSKPFAGLTTTVILTNPNNQTVVSLKVTTNEFGSYNGTFRLPENQLNGRYEIYDPTGGGSQDISVEEYKRPRFYVDYEKPKGSYRIGDSIRVTGLAKGYAGNHIDGAHVSYRVFRTTRFPYPWIFRRTKMTYVPYTANQEVASGTATTDASGKFSFVFYASADEEARRDYQPEFDYQVSADVTDLNGETRTGTTNIIAAYTGVKLSLEVAGGDHLPADSLRTVKVSARNLSDEPVGAVVHVSIFPLSAPDRLIRQRLWDAPDRFVMTEKQFLDSFPHDEYRDEREKEAWPRGGKVWDTTDALGSPDGGRPDTANSLHIPRGLLRPGWYVIEASTTDKSGQEVRDLEYVELYDGKTGRPGNPQYSWELSGETTAEPGGKALTVTGSSAADVYVIRTVDRAATTGQTQYSHFTLGGARKETEWPITESDRGGFGVLDVFVKDNRLYSNWNVVHVPWTNKQLDIKYASFRDKTQPGSAENWRMTISGHNGEKVSAEVLTTLYDASLDQFKPHSWTAPSIFPEFSAEKDWNGGGNFSLALSQWRQFEPMAPMVPYRVSELIRPMENRRMAFGAQQIHIRGTNVPLEGGNLPMAKEPLNVDRDQVYAFGRQARISVTGAVTTPTIAGSGGAADSVAVPQQPLRKDFRETAFFLPELRTDSAGSVSFSFSMPEALTTWKWMTLAGTRDLAFGYSSRSVITQKELMVQPNAPRFLREGDKMELHVKVVNLTDSELTGQMSLQLTDPTTGQPADGWFVNRQPNQYFTVEAHKSVVVGFPLDIPYQYNRPLTYSVVAQAGKYSDGEEATLPVVSNRMLVTESLPLNMPGDGTRHFEFDKLLKSGSSETLNHHALTVEFTANPAWYAVQSLPYLTEYPYECAEQTFERFYANALASKIATGAPRLREVFDRWRVEDTAQLLSNLQKDQELKTVLLEETPWVLQGKTESQQKKNIALLFDMDRMSRELGSALGRLQDIQASDGSFPWFKGGPDDRYITQYIVTGIGRLAKLGAIPETLRGKADSVVTAALQYLDEQIKKDYEREKVLDGRGHAGPGRGTVWFGGLPIQYLYMRSLWSNRGIPGDVFPAINYFRKKAQRDWVQLNKYLQGMAALALYRTGDVQTAREIVASLKQNAIHDEEKGMYWKGMEGGYYWYDAPVETQSLLIEAFHEIGGDAKLEAQLKTWLLRQKQTHSWPTTTATADACYALLLGGQDWLNAERSVDVRLGDKQITWDGGDVGYHKQVFDGAFVNPGMGNITVTMKTRAGGGSPAWGAVYWQYFDMLDRITPTGGGKPVLSVVKRLYIQRNSDHGPVLDTLADNATLKAGDRVVVRMVVKTDRDLEYVHLKDMRAACMEPLDVLSGYRWMDGLGYYETTRDVSTDFFFNHLPRGAHVFEYTMLAGQSGNFSNGVTSIECMYAPEFSYHSEGIRVNVEGTF
ncbi:MAG TPA: MG2 domain-containing protein [Puia sp.]|nr:MG2 domain-containing protein [Puia sp.]